MSEAVKVLVRNGMAGHLAVSGTGAALPAGGRQGASATAVTIADAVTEVISWPAAARRTATVPRPSGIPGRQVSRRW